MAVTVTESRVKFRKDQRPNKWDFLYGVDDVKEGNFFFLRECGTGCLPAVFEPHIHLNSALWWWLGWGKQSAFPSLPCQVASSTVLPSGGTGRKSEGGTWENCSSSFLLPSASGILARKVWILHKIPEPVAAAPPLWSCLPFSHLRVAPQQWVPWSSDDTPLTLSSVSSRTGSHFLQLGISDLILRCPFCSSGLKHLCQHFSIVNATCLEFFKWFLFFCLEPGLIKIERGTYLIVFTKPLESSRGLSQFSQRQGYYSEICLPSNEF